jgi:hypothetical protein
MKVFPNYNNIQAPMYIGSHNDGNYSEFKEDGTLRYNGDATVWKDMISNLFGQRLNSTSGNVAYDWDENALDFTAGSISNAADRVQGNLEINHEFKVGTAITFRPHIHWFQDIVSSAITYAFVLTAEYRLQRNNAEKTASWTAITCTAGTDDVFDFTGESDGTYNQISRFPDIVITCGISDTIQFRIARTDILGGNQLVFFFDMHGIVDSDGSDLEITKL